MIEETEEYFEDVAMHEEIGEETDRFEGPEFCDGPDEDGFKGPRPWNGFQDS